MTKFVKEQLTAGRQAYLVYPLVEESESLKAESATEAFEKWRKRLACHEVGLIHGKLRPEEKEEVMRRFREGQIAALVATTVIEVGVDVPNASVMILHHAERFGLAQLQPAPRTDRPRRAQGILCPADRRQEPRGDGQAQGA